MKQIKLATIYTGYFAIAYRVYLGVSELADASFKLFAFLKVIRQANEPEI